MKKYMKRIIIISLIVFCVLGTSLIVFMNNKIEEQKKEIALLEKKKAREKKEKEEVKKQEQDIKKNNIIEGENSKINNSVVSTDEEFVSYISDVEGEVVRIAEQKTVTENDKNTLKNTFITLTDFIFYGGTIKGKTFEQLQDETKVKVIDLYNRIDAKIESVSPNYKENIKTTGKKVYTNVVEKASNLKDNIKEGYKSFVGEDGYNQTSSAWESDKQSVKDVYEAYEPTIDKAKDKAKDTYENAKDKISSWYQGFKEGN